MKDLATHPDDRELTEFARGISTTDGRWAEVETHVAVCETCQSKLIGITADDFMLRLEDAADPETADRDGDRLSPGYEIVEEIGRGGAGVVYRARQRGLGREVAVKFLRSGGTPSPVELARFRREATVLARLQHPHIVTVHDVGEQNGCPFIAMELVLGESLAEALARGPLEARGAARLVAQLADALTQAHACGVIHRDLKPQNVLLQRSEDDPAGGIRGELVPKVADFGLSHLAGDESAQTRTGEPLGTPSYMAPEQIEGRRAEVSAATDIYGLGAILYESLTGRPPFRGATSMETMRMVRDHELVPIERIRPGIPRDLRTICNRCLQKEPARRFPSAAALRDDLQAFLSGRPIVSRPPGIVGRARLWVRRNPLRTLSVMACCLALGAGLAAFAWHQMQLRAERELAHAQYARARTAVWTILDEALKYSGMEIPRLSELILAQTRDALQLFEELREKERSPRSEIDLARVQMRAGTVFVELGQLAEGEELLKQSSETVKRLVQSRQLDATLTNDLIASQTKLAIVLENNGKPEDAITLLKEALALAEAPGELGPSQVSSPATLAWVHICLGNAYRAVGNVAKQCTHYQKAVDGYRAALRTDPTSVDVRSSVASAMVNLSEAQKQMRETESALKTLREAVGLLDELVRAAPANIEVRVSLATGQLNLSNHLAAGNDVRSAIKACQAGIVALEPVLEWAPKHATARSILAMLHANRAVYRCGQEEHAASIDDWRAAAKLTDESQPELSDYCRTMWIRSLASTRQAMEAMTLAEELQAKSLSAENQFRLAAAWGVVATAFGTEDSDGAPQALLHRQRSVAASVELIRKLAASGELAADPSSIDYIATSDDFAEIRRELGSEGLASLRTLGPAKQ